MAVSKQVQSDLVGLMFKFDELRLRSVKFRLGVYKSK